MSLYHGAMQGVLKAAGMGDYDLPRLAGMTGLGFHLIVEKGCCPSAEYAHFLAASWRGPSGLPEVAAKFAEIARVYAAMMPAVGQDFNEGGGS